jgi:hypothetical protein
VGQPPDEVKRKCDCDLKAEAIAIAAATAALVPRVADALSQLCSQELELCEIPLY